MNPKYELLDRTLFALLTDSLEEQHAKQRLPGVILELAAHFHPQANTVIVIDTSHSDQLVDLVNL